jgi:hypothetical protein
LFILLFFEKKNIDCRPCQGKQNKKMSCNEGMGREVAKLKRKAVFVFLGKGKENKMDFSN